MTRSLLSDPRSYSSQQPEPFLPNIPFSTLRRIRAPVTLPPTQVNQIPQGRKKMLREDNVVVDLLGRPPMLNTQLTPTRRQPFTKLATFQNANPFTLNCTSDNLSGAHASRRSKKQVRIYTFGDEFCRPNSTLKGSKMTSFRISFCEARALQEVGGTPRGAKIGPHTSFSYFFLALLFAELELFGCRGVGRPLHPPQRGRGTSGDTGIP